MPVEVVRKGKILKIVPESKPSKLSRLKKRNAIVGDPEDLVHMDWLKRVERNEVTYLDTHVVVWLYDGEVRKLS